MGKVEEKTVTRVTATVRENLGRAERGRILTAQEGKEAAPWLAGTTATCFRVLLLFVLLRLLGLWAVLLGFVFLGRWCVVVVVS